MQMEHYQCRNSHYKHNFLHVYDIPYSTHWGRVTHICVSNLTIIGSDNGLSPGRRQDIIWTNAGMLLIGLLETNFSEILIKIITFSVKKMHLKVSSAERRPFWLGLNVLTLSPFWSLIFIMGIPVAKNLNFILTQAPGTLLLTWINFNPSMHEYLHVQ